MKMLLKIVCTIFLASLSVSLCVGESISLNEKVGNITIKYGNTTEIRFQIQDFCTKTLQSQITAMRIELKKLTDMFDKCILSTSQSKQYPSTCAEAASASLDGGSGVYQILLPGYTDHPILVSCDEDTQNGGWTVVLRRMDGSVNFFRYWKDYKQGFGNVNGEFFIGLDILHEMTTNLDQELLIVMENEAGEKKFAKYDQFGIGNERDLYVLRTLGKFSGDAGDSLHGHKGFNFSSRDQDNDVDEGNCADMYTGAWWYKKCHSSNLMGKYNDNTYGKGINWYSFTGHNATLKKVTMMIRKIK